MATVLVSFIGTGKDGNIEYEETDYFFEDETTPRKTAIFGYALLEHLKDKGEKMKRWLIMGTKESIWSELIKISNNSDLYKDNETRKFLENESYSFALNNDYVCEISHDEFQDKLDKWEKILTECLTDTEVRCRLVGDANNLESQTLIFQSVLDAVKNTNKDEEKKIFFDVTHGLRNQPIITSFVIMYLRYLENIKIENIRFYYGAFDSRTKKGKAHTLDFCNKLLKATEAVAIYEQTGNYEQIGEQVNLGTDFNDKIKRLTFADEMHRASIDLPAKLKDKIQKHQFVKPIEKSLSQNLIKALDWSDDLSFAKRLFNKAVANKNKRQYFKAVASLYEAIAIASCLVVKQRENNIALDTSKYPDRDFAINDKNSGISTKLDASENGKLSSLKSLRNAILHGTDTNATQIATAISDEDKFINIFEGGKTVFDTIIKKI